MTYDKHTHLPLIQEYPGSQLSILEKHQQFLSMFRCFVWVYSAALG